MTINCILVYLHIKPAIHRIKYDMIQANPLKQEVHKRYPQVVDAISKTY